MLSSSITYRVPYADTDQMGYVYYANYLTYFERCRNELFREIDFPYTQFEEIGIMLPVVEAHCDYKQPAKYDDLITISATVTNLKGCRIRIENEIFNQQKIMLCRGYTRHAFMSSETRKPVRPPDVLMKKLETWNKE